MIKFFTLTFLIIFTLNARENPFFPLSGEVDIPLTSNQVKKVPLLKRASMTLPSTARTIQSFTIKYKNLDGSISEKTEILENSVDWHLPLFISQNYQTQSIKKEAEVLISEEFVKLASLKYITLYGTSRELKIITKDKMIRNFLLTKPHRIVCDFKRSIDIRSYEKKISKKSIATRVRLGNHKGYYRVVIELDGYYRYKNKDIKKGYIFTLL